MQFLPLPGEGHGGYHVYRIVKQEEYKRLYGSLKSRFYASFDVRNRTDVVLSEVVRQTQHKFWGNWNIDAPK